MSLTILVRKVGQILRSFNCPSFSYVKQTNNRATYNSAFGLKTNFNDPT